MIQTVTSREQIVKTTSSMVVQFVFNGAYIWQGYSLAHSIGNNSKMFARPVTQKLLPTQKTVKNYKVALVPLLTRN